ncbi:head GIN domain-containing protein [Weeksellaceae bacterium A-14]
MKTPVILLLSAAIVLSSCNIKTDSGSIFNVFPKEGKGPVKEKEVSIDFNGIRVVQSIKAEVVRSDTERVVISAPENLLDDVLVEKQDGKVYIHIRSGVNISTGNIRAKIYAKDFTALEAAASGIIDVKDKFLLDRADIKVSSSGSIQADDLEANQMDIQVSSSGIFTGKIWAVDLTAKTSSSGVANLSGKAKSARISVSSSGSLNGRSLTVQDADLQASSSGVMSLSVSDVLNASASSFGSIAVKKAGPLSVRTANESSSGSISVQ